MLINIKLILNREKTFSLKKIVQNNQEIFLIKMLIIILKY